MTHFPSRPLLPLTLLLLMGALTVLTAGAGTITFSRPADVYAVTGTEAKGYDAVYVVNGLSGMAMTYHAASPSATVTWEQYTADGESYAVPVQGVTASGADRTLARLDNQTSYTITEGITSTRVRIIDYTLYAFEGQGFAVTDPGTCLDVQVQCSSAAAIPFYTPVASRAQLGRAFTLTFQALEVTTTDATDDEAARQELAEVTRSLTLESIPEGGVAIDSPCRATTFTLAGDRFYSHFHSAPLTVSCSAPTPSTVIAAVNATETSASTRPDNMQGTAPEAGRFGGNAPVEMTFTAQANDAASFMQWQVSTDPNFEQATYTYPYADFSETFTEPGVNYVRFYAADATGTCSFTSETFIVEVGESALKCPNAFSPNDDGVNDVWKVSYRSLTEFDCHIFDRWGKEMYHFTNPADGWDGTRGGKGGKPAPAGVYYYSIKAKGADGKDYKLAGDINIIYYR